MREFIGQTIGRYYVSEQLGEGGKAFDTRLECDVAVKFIQAQKLTGENNRLIIKRFKNEAQRTVVLVHPNIVPVIDYGEFENIQYLVVKNIPGGTLQASTPGTEMVGYIHTSRRPLFWLQSPGVPSG